MGRAVDGGDPKAGPQQWLDEADHRACVAVRHFKSVLRKAGLPETVRFHDLRHSCAALLIAQGVHLSVIKDILGHTQISTTANVYGHALPDIQRDAASRLDDLLGPQPSAEGESIAESISPEEGGQDSGNDQTRDPQISRLAL